MNVPNLCNLILLFYLLKCPFTGYLSQRYKKQGEFGQIIQKSEKQKTKKTSKLSRTPRLV
ncbi:hypothetical protein F2Z23_13860 [Bacteroides eggerthii]|uniref:Uncharacterized protein n=1 Tax=Bacteroides eggerthii TaxID=28111 RepID=A0A4Q5GSK9_9BACE|nr:hypothetical protein F2Z23_13860 [Bacteroides eggerthii]KAA5285279.1 hypothetical protein F2Z10_10955 [Bacteroides eggerthii]RHI69677.1 hypothetical protein DW157_16785 [Bacteroides eggerthii]RYT71656.1 hypothetical protein EAJ03_13270 [Bacteroides eggerthii]